jgi:lysozyme family protein
MRRRDFLITAASGSAAYLAVPQIGGAAAQQVALQADNRDIEQLFASASDLLGAQAAAAGAQKTPLDIAELVLKALDKGEGDEKAADVAIQAGLLLSEINHSQRDARIFLGDIASAASAYPYSSLRDGYIYLLKQYKGPMPARKTELQRAADFINSQSAKERYTEVSEATKTKIPWYIIGALHYREANLNFMGHLHNGDPLLTKTYHVPAGRPAGRWPPVDANGKTITDPRTLWKLSALDALNGMVLAPSGWTGAGTCYSLEAYNGFGYHAHHVNSPYIWNYSPFYDFRGPPPYPAGGFDSDGHWNPAYVSKQAGLIPLIGQIMIKDPTFHWDLSA